MTQMTFYNPADMLQVDSWTGRVVRNYYFHGDDLTEVLYFDNSVTDIGTNFSTDTAISQGGHAAQFFFGGTNSNQATVTRLSLFEPLQPNALSPWFQATSFELPYATVMSYLNSGAQSTLIQTMLSGDDSITGSEFADVMVGYTGNDVIKGGNGNDTIHGAEGSDTLVGGLGNDYLVGDTAGSTSIDYARYDNQTMGDGYQRYYFGYFTTTPHENGDWTVAWASGVTPQNDPGVDLLSGVERLVFDDTYVALDIDSTPGQAFRIYKAAFDRTPDATGLGFWINTMDHGQSLLSVAQGFVGSAEFTRLYGANPTNPDFVDQLYLNVLDRPGETAGRDYWINALDHGLSRAEVLMYFSESTENIANAAPLIEYGIAYTPYAG